MLKKENGKRRAKRNACRWIAALFVLCLLFAPLGCGDAQSPAGTPAPGTEEPREAQEEAPAKDTAYQHAQVPVLYYHSVRIEAGNELCMPPAQLEEQMKFLADNHYQGITLDELYDGLYGTGGLPAKPVVITFDDGYQDNYQNAWPVLQKYGYTATVFIITDYIGEQGYLSAPELKALQENGWRLEGHSATHPYLTEATAAALEEELAGSKAVLEAQLDRPVKFFAYPFGVFDERVAQAVKDSGYTMAVTTERGWAHRDEDPMRVKRVYCYADMGIAEFERRLTDPAY
ncbi:MAG: polysaccharide deacetylase family protein [Peptococcaceae bacterium]|jgi:peptidoglycan/xylan/chitin deacetylase (PgdA/CDA1 family)|nr:polysaccharide deacetylase family protein [Peptococcaceae bacterium]